MHGKGVKMVFVGTASLDIDAETKRILLRSRQATSRPSPEPSPAGSPFGSTEDMFEAAAQEKATESEMSGGQEILLQETDPSTYVQFGSEVWRLAWVYHFMFELNT